jgi:hypothetical protein
MLEVIVIVVMTHHGVSNVRQNYNMIHVYGRNLCLIRTGSYFLLVNNLLSENDEFLSASRSLNVFTYNPINLSIAGLVDPLYVYDTEIRFQ